MDSHPAVTQKFWADEFNTILRKEYKLEQDLPTVFIDTFYDDESHHETEAFSTNSRVLLEYALSRKPFECKFRFLN